MFGHTFVHIEHTFNAHDWHRMFVNINATICNNTTRFVVHMDMFINIESLFNSIPRVLLRCEWINFDTSKFPDGFQWKITKLRRSKRNVKNSFHMVMSLIGCSIFIFSLSEPHLLLLLLHLSQPSNLQLIQNMPWIYAFIFNWCTAIFWIYYFVLYLVCLKTIVIFFKIIIAQTKNWQVHYISKYNHIWSETLNVQICHTIIRLNKIYNMFLSILLVRCQKHKI